MSSSNDNSPGPHRIYFNSVTGSVITPEQNERDMYEIDSDDEREQEENQIDQYSDVSDKDKLFYKIWNRFIKDKDKCLMYMKQYLMEFVNVYGVILIENGLKECLLLHLICLFDYNQINKETFIMVTNALLAIENQILKK